MVSTQKLKSFIESKVPVTENRALIRDFVAHRETKFVSVATETNLVSLCATKSRMRARFSVTGTLLSINDLSF